MHTTLAGGAVELRADADDPDDAEYERDLVVGELIAITEAGDAVLRFVRAGAVTVVRARTLVTLRPDDVGRQAVVQFERGDPQRPVALGLVRAGARPEPPAAGRVVIEAAQEIVLRCGSSSLTLGRDGKVMIRGDYVVSRSTGVNRVNGASVQIN